MKGKGKAATYDLVAGDLALGAQSAQRALQLYRDAHALPGDAKNERIAALKDSCAQAVLAMRFLMEFAQRQGADLDFVYDSVDPNN